MKFEITMKTLCYVPFLAITLAACGSGGSQSSTTAPVVPPTNQGPANQSPSITSAANISIDEYQTGKIYTMTAEDSDGQIADLALASTADAAFFTFDAATGVIFLSSPLTTPQDLGANNVYDLTLTATDDDGASTSASLAITVTDAGPPPSTSFDLLDWKLDLPINDEGEFTGLSTKIDEDDLADGYESQFFYTGFDGGIVMRSPSQGAKTSVNTSYTRTELREMLRRGNSNISTRGSNDEPNLNNWAFSSAPQQAQDQAGGVDGTLCVTLAVNEVTTTGQNFEVGRLIIGQIHAVDDEPIRLYYRKLPGNEKGSIYAAHELSGGDDSYFNLIGSRDNDQSNPAEGFTLNETFSYVIDAKGNELDVEVLQNGVLIAETTIDMSGSGYDVLNDFMYFKAGVYHVNNDADTDEAAQITLYQLENNHDGYGFNTASCSAATP